MHSDHLPRPDQASRLRELAAQSQQSSLNRCMSAGKRIRAMSGARPDLVERVRAGMEEEHGQREESEREADTSASERRPLPRLGLGASA